MIASAIDHLTAAAFLIELVSSASDVLLVKLVCNYRKILSSLCFNTFPTHNALMESFFTELVSSIEDEGLADWQLFSSFVTAFRVSVN